MAAASGSRETVLKVGRAKLAAETATEVAAMTYVARVTGIALSVTELLGYGLAVSFVSAIAARSSAASSSLRAARHSPAETVRGTLIVLLPA